MPKSRIPKVFTIPKRVQPRRQPPTIRFLVIGGFFLLFVILGAYAVSLLTTVPVGAPPSITITPAANAHLDITNPILIGCEIQAGDPLRRVLIKYQPAGRSWIILEDDVILQEENVLEYSFFANVTLAMKGDHNVYVYTETYLDVISDKTQKFEAHNPPTIEIVKPTDGTTIPFSYTVQVDMEQVIIVTFQAYPRTTDFNLQRAEAFLNGELIQRKTGSPFAIDTEVKISVPISQMGGINITNHVFKVTATDALGLTAVKESHFSISWNQQNSLSDEQWEEVQEAEEAEAISFSPFSFIISTIICIIVYKKVRKNI